MTEQAIKKVSRKRKPSFKSKVKKFLFDYMTFITAFLVTTILATIYLLNKGGYKDEDGSQIKEISSSEEVYVQNKYHGGSTSVPKDIRAIVRSANAIPKGMNIDSNGTLQSSYRKNAEILSYGRSIAIVYHDLTPRECKKAIMEEYSAALSISVNGSFEFTRGHAEQFIPKLCKYQTNTVSWTVRP